MAKDKKHRQSWKRDLETGEISFVYKNKDGEVIATTPIANAKKIFSEYPVFSNTKRDIILYGLQQRISDKLAVEKDKTAKDYINVFNSIIDGSFYEKAKTTRMTIKKRAEAIKDTLSIDQIDLLKKLGILD